MTDAAAGEKKTCSYKDDRWSCPFDAEDGHDLCIFHLPIDRKSPESFWRHLASYLMALLDKAGDESTKTWRQQNGNHWAFREADGALYTTYLSLVSPRGPWRFTGFVFPKMDAEHNFHEFIFGAADFADAEFNGRSDFGGATFRGEANFCKAKFAAEADFEFATFNGKAGFSDAMFSSKADFLVATFSGEASFHRATFSGEANFFDTTFSGEARFIEATFSGKAVYIEATFSVEACFHSARINSEAYFGYATFSGPVDLSRATVNALLDFRHTRLRNRLLFEGTLFDDNARVLLWDLDFVHGTSDLTMAMDALEGRLNPSHVKLPATRGSGQIIEPAGQVVFRDISVGMNRVSFLHTDILTDRLLVRFSNVKWETDPKQFIFDAWFAFCQDAAKWQEVTGLPEDTIARLRGLFHTGQEHPSEETKELRQQREAQELAECVPLVKRDVERIAREIRRSTEQYGSYSDAGDFHIAEMEYRRVQSPRFSFQWLLLAGYKCFSEYGESPRRAFKWLFGVWFVSALLYMFAGFTFGKASTFRYEVAFDERFAWPAFWHLCADFLHALAFSFVSLVPGYFRFSAPAEWPTPFTPFIVVAEAVFGIGLLTLFLLAIRRRFRR